MTQPQSGRQTMEEICDQLRYKTLQPAKEEATRIIAEAEEQAQLLIAEAERLAKERHEQEHAKIEREKSVFHSSLTQATKQALETLKQSIQQKLFQPALSANVQKEMARPTVIRDIIHAIVHALKNEGMQAPFSALIPKQASPEEINALLMKDILDELEGKSVALGDFAGGALVRVEQGRFALDMTDASVREVLERYLHKDFRKWLFVEE